MCGILGIVNKNSWHFGSAQIEKSLNLMKQRGPDDEGYLLVNIDTKEFEERVGQDTVFEIKQKHKSITDSLSFVPQIILGHRRLSILDLTPAGHQPMCDNSKKVWIIHNGEIYNFIEIRDELQKYGYIFRTQTDTEVILNAYKEWGIDCVKKFNGMWAFCILDFNKKVLILSRDRFGIKPLYYYNRGDYFAFASEIKGLLNLPFIPRRPNEKAIFEFLAYSLKDHNEQCFFENIYQLLPSHNLIYDLHSRSLKLEKYWQLRYSRELNVGLSDDDIYEHFKELFRDAVKLRLRSDVPVGSCLSGGLDSSSIVCSMNQLLNSRQNKGFKNTLNTFTAAYEDKKIDERRFVAEVLKTTGAKEHFVFPNADGLLLDLEKVLWHQDEPFAGTTVYAQWKVMNLAKYYNVKVLLDGQGGDELLGGYSIYYGIKILQELLRWKVLSALKETGNVMLHSDMNLDRILYEIFRAGQWLVPTGILNLGRGINTIKIVPNTLIKKYAKERGRFIPMNKKQMFQDKSYQDITGYNLQPLLHYEDRNSMAFSIETRLPFLDYRLVEFVFSLPVEYKMKNGWSKYILRESMKGILPERVRLRRDKKGFTTPQRQWLYEYKDKILEILRAEKFRSGDFINPKKMIDKIHSLTNARDISSDIWRSFMTELWMRRFIYK